MLPFIHLSVHSEYSLVKSVIAIPDLVQAAVKAEMPACALTDTGNLFGMIKFYKEARTAGVKPLIGMEVYMVVEEKGEKNTIARMTLLCQSREGYRNLANLISRAYREGQDRDGTPLIHHTWFSGMSAGMIALSGAQKGDVGQALLRGRLDLAESRLQHWQTLFPDRYYLEVQRTYREGENNYLTQALDLAGSYGLPLVATNDVCFLQPEAFDAHEARVCIAQGWTLEDERRQREYSSEQYFKTSQEMSERFIDLPEALENSFLIAQRCNLTLSLGKPSLPNFPIPTGETTEDYFSRLSYEGLAQRIGQWVKLQPTPPTTEHLQAREHSYRDRLQLELDVIIKMGFPGYFLIVADFIQWAKNNKVPVGPGRGSGAGSLVAYSLGITDLDPIAYDLLFERFLNPERVSLPDFDVDFCMEGRDRVIDYVIQRYGHDRVSQIITYGSMAAKAVVRDVGRILGQPYGFVDKISKLIPFEIGITLDKALADEESLRKLYEEDELVRAIIDLAKPLEGLARNAGKHAGGVVIAPSELIDFTPLYYEPGGSVPVTQLDKDDIEAIGLVKFDFLGLRTLTIIQWATDIVNQFYRTQDSPPLDIITIPLDDPKTFQLLQNAQTTAVFQLESRGMKELIRRLKPDCFEDIVALVALFRPGPLQSGMVDDFINRKHRRVEVIYPHPSLEPVLKPTYGVILYQEQVMQIAQVLAGYSLGGADLLRRAMGKKKPEEMAKQRSIFTQGATERGTEAETATYIFDLMEKFAGYGFNKSHSAAYALVSYQTAYLKSHYPAAFMAAVLSSDMDKTDKIVPMIAECQDMGLTVLPPDVNRSVHRFTVVDEQTILYGLGAIKGIGSAVIDTLLENRKRLGQFTTLEDFCFHLDRRAISQRVLETLIRSGALDSLEGNRATMMSRLATVIQQAEQGIRNHQMGMSDLFGFDQSQEQIKSHELPEWDDRTRLEGEKETLGLYLTKHPLSIYRHELKYFTKTLKEINDHCQSEHSGEYGYKKRRDRDPVTVAGLVTNIRVMNTKSGNRMAIITLDDQSDRVEARLFSEKFDEYKELLVKDQLLVVKGTPYPDEYSGGCQMTLEEVMTIAKAREQYAKNMTIHVEPGKKVDQTFPAWLEKTLKPFQGGSCPIKVQYRHPPASVTLILGEHWRVRLPDELLLALKERLGDQQVNLDYGQL